MTMQKTIFRITKMDCPSEENLIRMKLDGMRAIKNLDFDIPNRTLTVFHDGQGSKIEQSIIDLDLGGKKVKTRLVADSLDMLADAFVYGISLFAVGGTLVRKKKIAKIAGYFQITLAVVGFVEVLRRFLGVEKMPDFSTMIIVSVFALIANGICLYLLQKSKSKEAHMQASMIFTSNDVVINLGVIIAGDPSFSEIWSPTDGFIFTAGVRVKIFGEDDHH